MLVADWLWPRQARQTAQYHDRLYHSGVPTAHIDVDGKSLDVEGPPRPPRYKVTCSKCSLADLQPEINVYTLIY